MIGAELAKIRKSRGFTQAEAAERCGVDVSTFNRIEKNRAVPTVETLVKLSRGLACQTDRLLGLNCNFWEGDLMAANSRGIVSDLDGLVRELNKAKSRIASVLGVSNVCDK